MASIELEIEDNKWPDFVRYFCITHPNQTSYSENPVTDAVWVKQRILLFARGSYIKGLRHEYEQLNGPNIDMDIITL